MQHLADHLSSLELVELLDDEVLPVLSLPAYFLLNGACAWAHRQMVLNHLPWYTRKIRRSPSEHVGVLLEEGSELAFLLAGKRDDDAAGCVAVEWHLLGELGLTLYPRLARGRPHAGRLLG